MNGISLRVETRFALLDEEHLIDQSVKVSITIINRTSHGRLGHILHPYWLSVSNCPMRVQNVI